MENVYVAHRGEIQRRRKECTKLKSELGEIEERISNIEPGSLFYKDGTYDELSYQANLLKTQISDYSWTVFTEKEFKDWYMEENKGLWKTSNGEIICDLCRRKIENPEDIRSHGGINYHSGCFKKYTVKELQDKNTDGRTEEFLLRSLRL